MKTSILTTMLVSIPFLIYLEITKSDSSQTVNSIIGDQSYLSIFEEKPNSQTNEKQRLITHLKFVENKLRAKETTHLTYSQKRNREHLLNLLNTYLQAGNFPKNYDYPNKRVPCFIDKDGNICAVGYLIEKTAGRAVSEKINQQYQYEQLMAMNDSKIDSWIEWSGLTKEECAMIQPQYGFYYPSNYPISDGYAISTSLLTGTNIAMNVINGYQIKNGSSKKSAAITGLITGGAQLAFGSISLRNNSFYYGTRHQNISMLNIGLGTSTILFSTWNLIRNKTPKTKATYWNVYSFPTPNENFGVGLSFSKRF